MPHGSFEKGWLSRLRWGVCRGRCPWTLRLFCKKSNKNFMFKPLRAEFRQMFHVQMVEALGRLLHDAVGAQLLDDAVDVTVTDAGSGGNIRQRSPIAAAPPVLQQMAAHLFPRRGQAGAHQTVSAAGQFQ